MAKVKIYSYSKCSTCLKALKYLKGKKVSFELLDITTEPPAIKDLELMLKNYNGEIKKLFNTSGVAYRELKIKDKIHDMKPQEAIKVLSKNGRLVKRPFLIKGASGLVGFKEDEWEKLFL